LEEALRERISSPALRISFGAFQQDKYELLIDLLQAQHHADPFGGHEVEAFDLSERVRGRVLLESLLDARVDLRGGVDPAVLDPERALQQRLSDTSAQLSRMLASKTDAARADAAARTIDELTRDYERLQAEILRQSPRYAAVTQPQPLRAAEIQKTVIDD